ncbi:porin [Ideonella sp. YS5]|uniref:porin n=1 Tax=Ideonella sp. YS5 TaxID=3453714 RepID=UPI003EF03F95
MNKSLIALAALGAFAGAAQAQSSVTVYGFIDQSMTKPYASEDKMIADGSFYGGGSRLGFRGVEDLGNGYKATFGLEHRLNADTGNQNNATFWRGYSTVGLVTPFGAVNLGYQYVPAFTMIQNQIDPFGGETVAQGREVGFRYGVVGAGGSTASAIYKTRVVDSVRYDLSVAGFNLGVSVAESASNNGGVSDKKPFSIAGNYAAGPFWIGVGYENPADADDKGWNIGGRYTFSFATFAAGYTKGTTAAGADAKGWLVGATVPLGAFDLKGVYATNDIDGIGETKKVGLGAHYNFSKRTKIYADVAKIGGSATSALDNKTGYDLGLKHTF